MNRPVPRSAFESIVSLVPVGLPTMYTSDELARMSTTYPYESIRDGVVLFTENRGIVRATGTDRLDLLHRLSTADIGGLSKGGHGVTIVTNEKGRIVDILDLLVDDASILMRTRQESATDLLAHLDRYTIMDDVVTADITDESATLTLCGNGAVSMVPEVLGIPRPSAGAWSSATFAGETLWLFPGERLNGPVSVAVILPRTVLEPLVEAFASAGALPIDLLTVERLMIEAGSPAPGREITDKRNPLELGLASLVSFTKGCYIGQEVVARLDSYDKVKNRLVGLRIDRRLDGGDFALRSRGERIEQVGQVSSLAAIGPDSSIGLALVRSLHANPETTLDVVDPNDPTTPVATAEITMLPMDIRPNA